jgi:hypothetical protein
MGRQPHRRQGTEEHARLGARMTAEDARQGNGDEAQLGSCMHDMPLIAAFCKSNARHSCSHEAMCFATLAMVQQCEHSLWMVRPLTVTTVSYAALAARARSSAPCNCGPCAMCRVTFSPTTERQLCPEDSPAHPDNI